jgi:glycosyltransferase involved in cell wall biosynthesis
VNIAVLNWRDSANPKSGGAEVFIHEVARKWADAGHHICIYCSRASGQKAQDSKGTLSIVRVGSLRSGTHHLLAAEHLKRSPRPDVILESINTVPYLLPLRATRLPPFVPLVHQLAKDVWGAHFPKPVARMAQQIEPWLYRPYRDVNVLAVSESTKADLQAVGVRNVSVLPQGGLGQQETPQKEPNPTFIFAGRLTPNKRPDHAVEAFRLIKQHIPEARFWIIGEGTMTETILRRLPEGAEMFGRVSRSELLDRLGRAHLLLATSIREGWGLVVTEANALGTPAVAYDVPGFRDSIKTGTTGLLVPPTPEAMASAACRLVTHSSRYNRIRQEARAWGSFCTWDHTAQVLLAHLCSTAGISEET